jgi:hypothetical protein
MDYSKMGAANSGKNHPRHKEHNAPGSGKNPFGRPKPKSELVEKLAKAAKAGKDDKATDDGK